MKNPAKSPTLTTATAFLTLALSHSAAAEPTLKDRLQAQVDLQNAQAECYIATVRNLVAANSVTGALTVLANDPSEQALEDVQANVANLAVTAIAQNLKCSNPVLTTAEAPEDKDTSPAPYTARMECQAAEADLDAARVAFGDAVSALADDPSSENTSKVIGSGRLLEHAGRRHGLACARPAVH